MNEYVKKIKENTPFHFYMMYEEGHVEIRGSSLPLAIRGRSKIPNMQWAMNTIKNNRIAPVKKAIFYENGQEIGTYENGRYFGKYQNYE